MPPPRWGLMSYLFTILKVRCVKKEKMTTLIDIANNNFVSLERIQDISETFAAFTGTPTEIQDEIQSVLKRYPLSVYKTVLGLCLGKHELISTDESRVYEFYRWLSVPWEVQQRVYMEVLKNGVFPRLRRFIVLAMNVTDIQKIFGFLKPIDIVEWCRTYPTSELTCSPVHLFLIEYLQEEPDQLVPTLARYLVRMPLFAKQFLHHVCRIGNRFAVQMLLENGTPFEPAHLCTACTWGHIWIVRLFLEHGVRLSLSDQSLHRACEGGHTEIVRLLLDHGMPPNSSDLDIACMFQTREMVWMILDHKVVPTLHSIDIAYRFGDAEMVQLMLDIALENACLYGNRSVVTILMNRGTIPTRIAVEYAYQGGDVEIVRLLNQ
jgi:hypothetical protein